MPTRCRPAAAPHPARILHSHLLHLPCPSFPHTPPTHLLDEGVHIALPHQRHGAAAPAGARETRANGARLLVDLSKGGEGRESQHATKCKPRRQWTRAPLLQHHYPPPTTPATPLHPSTPTCTSASSSGLLHSYRSRQEAWEPSIRAPSCSSFWSTDRLALLHTSLQAAQGGGGGGDSWRKQWRGCCPTTRHTTHGTQGRTAVAVHQHNTQPQRCNTHRKSGTRCFSAYTCSARLRSSKLPAATRIGQCGEWLLRGDGQNISNRAGN